MYNQNKTLYNMNIKHIIKISIKISPVLHESYFFNVELQILYQKCLIFLCLIS